MFDPSTATSAFALAVGALMASYLCRSPWL